MTLTLNTNLLSFTELVICIDLLIFRPLAAAVSEIPFPIEKPVTKFDFAVNQVKVTPGSSFEQTMMGRSPRCYIPSFVEIGPPIPEKMFEGFLPYMGMVVILVM